MIRKNRTLAALTMSGALLAIGLVLPFVTGQIPAVATIISPLHIPALIGGFVLGPVWGMVLGAILPLVRSVLFGLPAFPTAALPMVFELAAYGLFCGLLDPLFRRIFGTKRLPALITAQLAAMLLGRIVGGAAKALLLTFGIIGAKAPFTLAVFFTSYFISTAPGALIHLVLVPAVVTALEKAGLSPARSPSARG